VSISETMVEAGYAIAIGLVIGFEREHHVITEHLAPADVPEKALPRTPETVAGSRTFALFCLAGWLVALLGERYAAVAPAGLAVIGGLIGAQYFLAARRDGPLGLTTEAAAAVTVLLGMLVRQDRALAVMLALATALLLISKPWMQAALSKLRRLEVTATVQLLVAVAIVLPLLPSAPLDPWQAIPPRKVGVFVVLIAGVEYVGYVLHRLLGARRGVALAGIVGGLTSSTAVTAAMARQARRAPSSIGPCQLATLLANAVMGVRITVIAALLSPALALRLAAPMGALVAVLLIGALWRFTRAGDEASTEGLALRNPFALVPALTWGAVLCVVLLATTLAQRTFGDSGILVAAAAAGLADVDAITLAASRQSVAGALSVDTAALAITIAVASNTVVKAGIAWVAGGRRFGLAVSAWLALGLALAGAVAACRVLL
jgi:uncharacterized membrane protein (DUF4010 family)